MAAGHARWFDARGWQVRVVAPEPPERPDGLDLEPVDLPVSARAAGAMAVAARRLARIRRAFRPDVVHCHGLRSFAATLASGARPFVTLHGAGPVASDPPGWHR